MATLHLLGTGAPLSQSHRTTTMLACTSDESTLVIDCGGDVVQRLFAARIELDTVEALILTHEHVDHTGGFPLMMEKLWLSGRRRPLPVYGLESAIDQARRSFATYDTKPWVGLPEIHWTPVESGAGSRVLSNADWQVTAASGIHPVPVIGLRIASVKTRRVMVYSADTAPSEAITRLAARANILVHEATGSGPGHSSASEAARTAAVAGVQRLLLVHIPRDFREKDIVDARRIFAATELGQELGAYPI